jgi:hypothetical protein
LLVTSRWVARWVDVCCATVSRRLLNEAEEEVVLVHYLQVTPPYPHRHLTLLRRWF